LLVAISVASLLLGYVCGAYSVKGKDLSPGQPVLLWFVTAFLAVACVFFYMAGGLMVYAGCYLLLCVGQLVAMLLHSGRGKPV